MADVCRSLRARLNIVRGMTPEGVVGELDILSPRRVLLPAFGGLSVCGYGFEDEAIAVRFFRCRSGVARYSR